MIAARSEFYFFQTDLRLEDSKRAGVTVAFCGERDFDRGRLGEGLKAAVAYPSDPGLVLVVGLQPYQEAFVGLAADLEIWVPETVKIAIVMIDSRRTLHLVGENPDGTLDPKLMDEYTDEIFSAGLDQLFKTSGAVIRSGPGYHFEAPGGKHMSTFVRASHMFTDTARTAFAACAALHKIGDLGTIQHLSTDTSSINSIAYEFRRLQEAFLPDEQSAIVGSFGGHAALDQRTSLPPARTSLFVISVSSTGSLITRILAERKEARVLVIVGIGGMPAGEVMYSPGSRYTVDDEIPDEEAQAVDRRHCIRCTAYDETVVKIDGEQLLPLTPSVFSRLLVRSQAKQWTPPHLQALVELDSVEAHFIPETRGKGATRRPIYFDFARFFAELGSPNDAPSIERLRIETRVKLETLLEDIDPTHVIHLPDVSSEALAHAAAGLANRKNPPKVLDAGALSGSEGTMPTDKPHRILVVASAASSGSALNSVSRDLRPYVEQSPVRYFVFMPRTQDAEAWRFIQSNLRTGPNTEGARTKVEFVTPAWLPSEKTLLGSVWDDEESFWTTLLSQTSKGQARSQIQARLDVLGLGSMKNNVFLGSGADMNDAAGRLALHPNFALWDFPYEGSRISQAAVYMVFAAVLDWSRSPGGDKGNLDFHGDDPERELERFFDTTQRQHNLTALHPFNFDRFNDAIANAALLRGSLPWELDYSASPGLSASMLAVLHRIVESFELSPADSPLLEFLLAIASLRLRLHPKHLELFVEQLAIDLPPVAERLAHYIAEILVDGSASAASDAA